MKRHVCQIIAPDILEKIEKNGTPAEKEAIRRTLITSRELKKRRELAPVPQESAGSDRKVYTAKNKKTLPGTKVRSEVDHPVQDQTVNEAFDGAGNTYRLFLAEYDRKSLDGKGLALISTVHYDKDFDNAFWDGSQMVYGDGFFFNAFTRDLTVVGHELGHGITQYTGNLDYQGQSGALNEHMSDVFGALVEQYAYIQSANEATWIIGGELCVGKIKGRGLRDMLNPGTAYDDPIIGKDPQGADMAHYIDTLDDNGGVHLNSGIPNRAFALACIERGGYAWETIGKVWYETLIKKVTSTTQFLEFANFTYLMAGELYGKNSTEQQAVVGGWDAVGIAAKEAPSPAPVPNDSPCLPMLLSILSDPQTRKKLIALGEDPKVRQFVVQAYAAMKKDA